MYWTGKAPDGKISARNNEGGESSAEHIKDCGTLQADDLFRAAQPEPNVRGKFPSKRRWGRPARHINARSLNYKT
jgi:hypothetical protein